MVSDGEKVRHMPDVEPIPGVDVFAGWEDRLALGSFLVEEPFEVQKLLGQHLALQLS